jgi:hypothetical protein
MNTRIAERCRMREIKRLWLVRNDSLVDQMELSIGA